MTKQLHISKSLSLPVEAVTQTFAILAKRGVGKTYTAAVMAEEMLGAGQQVIIVDPVGAWWGLKSSADGKSAGFPVAVFGGEHADIPLDEHAGETVAKAIVDRRFSAILDLSLFRKGQLIRFMTAFAEAMYHANREPVHLFVDEADAVAPQRPGPDEARLLGAFQDIVRRGRRRGIGCTLITQRPQVLSKDVLTQCEVLLPMRLVHPRDINAIEEWVSVHADPAAAKAMVGDLPSLEVGTAFIWGPGIGIELQKVRIRERKTFDSSATPKVGQKVRTPKVLAEVDLEQLGAAIKATATEARENSPAALRKKLADAQAELSKLKAAPAKAPAEVKTVEKPVVSEKALARLEALQTRTEEKVEAWWKRAAEGINPLMDLLHGQRTEIIELRKAIGAATAARPAPPAVPASRPLLDSVGSTAHLRTADWRAIERRTAASAAKAVTTTDGVSTAEQKVLDALAWWEAVGVTVVGKHLLAVIAGYTVNGHFNNLLGGLRSKGFIDYPSGGMVQATSMGRSAANHPGQPGTLADLHEAWRQKLSESQWKIAQAVMARYPASIEVEDLAAAAGYTVNGHFNNMLGSLRSLGVITKKKPVAATELLFPTQLG